jgi:hypothetical protein
MNTKHRIKSFLSNFNNEELKTHFENEDLIFIKGALYGKSRARNNYNLIAQFSFNELSVTDIRHKSVQSFNEPLAKIANDNSKYIQVLWGNDELGLIKHDFNIMESINTFRPYDEIFSIISKTTDAEKDYPYVDVEYEEINGVFEKSYTFRMELNSYGRFIFKSKTINLFKDETFHNWIILFVKLHWDIELDKTSVCDDIVAELKKLPKMPDDKNWKINKPQFNR